MRCRLRQAVAALASAAAMVITAAPAPAWAASGWQVERVFGRPDVLDVQAIGASGPGNAWLLGLVPNPEPTFVTQRWNGHHWVPVALPARLTNVIGPWRLFSGIYTTSPSNTWFFPVLPHREAAIQYALHWNGSAWTTVAKTRAFSGVSGLTPDGSGGFWLTATDPAGPRAGDIIDYRHGAFTSQPAPAVPGYTDTANGIAAVPGTRSDWATGVLARVTSGTSETAILRYTP